MALWKTIKRSSIMKRAYQLFFFIMTLLPKQKRVIMFESFLGKQFSCNPRAIYEYLKSNDYDYKMYWSADKNYLHNFEGQDINYVKRFSPKWMMLMARAGYWVTNSRLPLWINKPNGTVYLQTWHGTPLKKLAADMDEVHMPGTTTEKYKRNFYQESRNWDYLISPNAYSTEIFKRAFQFDKDMIESGYPRNDYLITHNEAEYIEQLKVRFDIPVDKKVVLYAPTWRDDQFYAKGRYKFDLPLDLEQMKAELGDDYVILLRMHYLIAENFDLEPHKGFVYDFSNHEDIRDLYLVSDLLVTDYSSVFFDYANLKRPVIFYVYDIDRYSDELRGFYFDLKNNAPGPLTKDTLELIGAIKAAKNDSTELGGQFEPFHNKFCHLESGQSAQKVVERVFLGRKQS